MRSRVSHLVPELFFLVFRLISILEVLHDGEYLVWILFLFGASDSIVVEDLLPLLRHTGVCLSAWSC